jgi:predicted RNase H-like nuclease
MFFIGLDLVWAARNRTGVAVVDAGGGMKHIATAISNDDILQVLEPYVGGDCVVAIDAPLRVTNETNPRPADTHLNVDFKNTKQRLAQPTRRIRMGSLTRRAVKFWRTRCAWISTQSLRRAGER